MSTEQDRRAAFGEQLKKLRGSRRQVDIVNLINGELEMAGETQRLSQGQYSQYERGEDRPLPVRLRAIERAYHLPSGALTEILDGAEPGRRGLGKGFEVLQYGVPASFGAIWAELSDEDRARVLGYAEARREAARQPDQ